MGKKPNNPDAAYVKGFNDAMLAIAHLCESTSESITPHDNFGAAVATMIGCFAITRRAEDYKP